MNSMKGLHRYLKTIASRHEKALAWQPENGSEQQVLKRLISHNDNLSSMTVDSTPGFWLFLKIHLELCAFDPINR